MQNFATEVHLCYLVFALQFHKQKAGKGPTVSEILQLLWN